MIRKLIPVILALLGLGAGVGAGLFLRPAPEDHVPAEAGAAEPATDAHSAEAADPEAVPEYVKMNNQFVVPVMDGGKVVSMVILSLSLEVETGTSEQVYAREPKLRDAFLQVLFDHANSGGFEGSFTDGANLVLLRRAMMETAEGVLGAVVKDVLISDIARQDS